jgi:mRNA-degrading endonuclease RelE of RelBE toxin-antitoxin system
MALYAVSFRRSAEKDLRRLDVATQQRVYTVDDAVLVGAIERVRHRREVYR